MAGYGAAAAGIPPNLCPGGDSQQNSYSALLNPEQFAAIRETDGIVRSIDVPNQWLGVLTPLKEEFPIHVDHRTVITDVDSTPLTLSDLHEKDRVRIYYLTLSCQAWHVDRLETFYSLLLGR
jgi:hypothetical protein